MCGPAGDAADFPLAAGTPPGRGSRALSHPGSGPRPEAAPARRLRSTPHPPPRSGRRPPAEAQAGERRHRRAPRRRPPRRAPTPGTCESAGGSGAAPPARARRRAGSALVCVCLYRRVFNHSYYLMSSRNSLELELILCLRLVVLPLSCVAPQMAAFAQKA
ncbi:putative hydro-lyase KRH_21160 [Pipra filicauda]|uniref:Hydro-lyase KRH_21160 n=1 Tax=Pipra filicauda TaxID=649802 RepID=A0A7R5KKR4_9PASS|nr:putative hydro-lyase KRH_21160 [Pipra filicauda]